MKRKSSPLSIVRPDARDASKDFFIPIKDAMRLFDEGKLSLDITNGGYCLPSNWHHDWLPSELMNLKEMQP